MERGHGRPPNLGRVPSDQIRVLELAIDDEEDAGRLPSPVAERLRVVTEALGDQVALVAERWGQIARLCAAPPGMRVVAFPEPDEPLEAA